MKLIFCHVILYPKRKPVTIYTVRIIPGEDRITCTALEGTERYSTRAKIMDFKRL